MRSNRPLAAAAACTSHASRAPCKDQKLLFAWCVRRVRFASRCGGERAFGTNRMHSTNGMN
eukprot:10769902-Lingulodinium_polyedra.AAC.1